MGSSDETVGQEEAGKKGRRWIGCGCGWAFAVSMAGGLMLGWWEHQYHPGNRQLWMVPVGLILFLTPLFAWLSLVISDLCSSSSPKDHHPSLVPTPHASIEVAVAGGGSTLLALDNNIQLAVQSAEGFHFVLRVFEQALTDSLFFLTSSPVRESLVPGSPGEKYVD